MEKKMDSSKPLTPQKNKFVILKATVLILATALVLRMCVSGSYSTFEALNNGRKVAKTGQCNLFRGDWVPNPEGPAYTNETCKVIDEHQNCIKNGRPDSGYLHWRWSPRDCELPRFDAERFLEMMKDKSWALIGDSIARNQIQSLLCLLSKVEEPVLFYHDRENKSKSWRFPSYNLTMHVLWSPFLVKAAIFEDINGVSSQDIQLHLDKVDPKWAKPYKNLDYVIISTGQWFLKEAVYYENNAIVGCHYCSNKALSELGFEYAYRKSLKTVLNFIADSGHEGVVFFRTSTPDHFEGGRWFEGGSCKRTAPFKEGQVRLNDLLKLLRVIELEELLEASRRASRNGVRLKLLDFTELSLLRPDGHPGPYRHFHPFAEGKSPARGVQNDCLHWCVPGPIDAWNDILMEVLVKS